MDDLIRFQQENPNYWGDQDENGVESFEGLYERFNLSDFGGFTVRIASLDDLISMKRGAAIPSLARRAPGNPGGLPGYAPLPPEGKSALGLRRCDSAKGDAR